MIKSKVDMMFEDMSKTTHWQCPGCGYLVTAAVYQRSQTNFQCGGCRDHKLGTFRSVHIIGTGEAGRKIGE